MLLLLFNVQFLEFSAHLFGFMLIQQRAYVYINIINVNVYLIILQYRHEIKYMCGAPITMLTMLSHAQRFKFAHEVQMLTGGAPPPPSLMRRFTEETGVSIRTSYGLTESYGPATFHLPDPQWEGNLHACMHILMYIIYAACLYVACI